MCEGSHCVLELRAVFSDIKMLLSLIELEVTPEGLLHKVMCVNRRAVVWPRLGQSLLLSSSFSSFFSPRFTSWSL